MFALLEDKKRVEISPVNARQFTEALPCPSTSGFVDISENYIPTGSMVVLEKVLAVFRTKKVKSR